MSDSVAPIRLVIADDHLLFRQAVRIILEAEPGFLIVAEAEDGGQAVELCSRFRPDVLLLDVSMPRVTGMEALSLLRQAAPSTAAVLLTAGIDRGQIFEAVMLGARGVILKNADTAVLVRCLREVAAGSYWIEHHAISDLVDALRQPESQGAGAERVPAPLTEREREIVEAVAAGATNADIGHQFGMRPQTVKNHMTRIFDKLGVRTRLELALHAVNRPE